MTAAVYLLCHKDALFHMHLASSSPQAFQWTSLPWGELKGGFSEMD